MNHSLNPAKRLLCGGTQRNTAKRLYTGTQYVVIVTGHSDKMLSKAHNYIKVYNSARGHKMRLMQLFPLNLLSHGLRVCMCVCVCMGGCVGVCVSVCV